MGDLRRKHRAMYYRPSWQIGVGVRFTRRSPPPETSTPSLPACSELRMRSTHGLALKDISSIHRDGKDRTLVIERMVPRYGRLRCAVRDCSVCGTVRRPGVRRGAAARGKSESGWLSELRAMACNGWC